MSDEDDVTGPEEFVIAVGGAELPGIEAGEGLPVVFLHAGVADHRMWLSQVEAVAGAGFHAIAYDRRGFGEATSPDEPFSHIDDLEGVLDALGLHAAVLVGCSKGGALAIDFALAHPGRTAGLLLVGTGVTGGDLTMSDTDELMEAAMADAEERGDPEFQNKVDAHAWLDGPRSENGRVGGPVRELFLEMNGLNLRQPRLSQQERPPSARDRIASITAPTFLVVGELDFDYTVGQHESLGEELPNPFAVVLEGTAHLPNLERPELFNPLLLEFLTSIGE